MPGMSEHKEKRRGVGCLIMGAAGFLLLVLYVLGMGPAAWLSLRSPFWERPLGILYAPLAYLSNHFGPAHRVITWYINLWIT